MYTYVPTFQRAYPNLSKEHFQSHYLVMDSTFGTVIEETVFPMDIGPLPSNAVASTIGDSVDFDLSGISVISSAKDEEIQKLREEIARLKEEQEGMAIEVASLKDNKSELELEVHQLKGKVEEMFMEESVAMVEKEFLGKELMKAQSLNSHQEHKILLQKNRIGDLMRQLHKFRNGVWYRRNAAGDAVGYGSVLNGEDVFWVKGSQMEWDEDFHRPLFGLEESTNTNFVMLQRTEAGEGRVLVNAVGCYVIPDTLLEFRLNNREVAHFGFSSFFFLVHIALMSLYILCYGF